uniref:Uncharacterized protein n=1 Tax=Sphaerodactylus townsendi TaxID=933632 RepID=A0ACB8F4E7_9SAUR
MNRFYFPENNMIEFYQNFSFMSGGMIMSFSAVLILLRHVSVVLRSQLIGIPVHLAHFGCDVQVMYTVQHNSETRARRITHGIRSTCTCAYLAHMIQLTLFVKKRWFLCHAFLSCKESQSSIQSLSLPHNRHLVR